MSGWIHTQFIFLILGNIFFGAAVIFTSIGQNLGTLWRLGVPRQRTDGVLVRDRNVLRGWDLFHCILSKIAPAFPYTFPDAP